MHTVRLRYWSRPFSVGLAISLCALAGVAYIGWRRVRAFGLLASLCGTQPPAGWREPEVLVAYGSWSARKRLCIGLTIGAMLALLVAVVAGPLRTDYVLGSAELLRKDGDTRSAADICRKVLARDPDNRRAHAILGACYHDESRWGEAVAELNEAARLGALDPWSRSYLASSYERLGLLDQAEAAWRELTHVAPYDRGARRALAQFMQRRARQH